jgi:hypothetical protein
MKNTPPRDISWTFFFSFFVTLAAIFFLRRKISIELNVTWVCVSPKEAANSARSGRARYWVRWNRRLSCCSWSDE